MPLHGEDVRRPGPAQRLDDMVRFRPRLDNQIATEVLDRLMVHRVGLGELEPRIELREPGSGHNRGRVAVFVVDIPVAMIERTWKLRGEILVERSALRDVDHLRAAAHAEHRLARGDESAQQRDLVSVADPIAGPFRLERLFAVAIGTDVRATHQHQAVQLAGVVADGDAAAGAAGVPVGRRDHQCHRVLLHHPVRHLLLDVLQRLALEDEPFGVGVEETGGDTDFQHGHDTPASFPRIRETPASFPRMRESSDFGFAEAWIPASAGMTSISRRSPFMS